MSKKKRTVLLIVLLSSLMAIFLCIFFYMNSYVAMVDGERITRDEYSFFLNSVKVELEEQAKVSSSLEAKKTFWDSKIAGKDAKDRASEIALERLKEVKIELIKARENGISLSEAERKEIQQALAQKITEMGGEDEAKKIILRDYGISLKSYEEIFEKLRIVYNFMNAEQNNIQISDDEAKEYYEENRNKLDIVTVVHILIAGTDSKTGQQGGLKDDEAKNKAFELLERVNKGEDIKALAQKYSEDLYVMDNKGEVEIRSNDNENYYGEIFKKWALENYEGNTGVIRTSNGYHVMKVIKRTDFSEVKEEAIKGAREERFEGLIEEWKKMPQYNLDKNERVLKLFE